MNPAVSHLLYRRQSNRAIEEYVEDFCGLCHLAGFNNVVLNDMFRVGLNEPIRSRLPEGKIHWSLEQYIDHALLLSGSSYTGSCKGGTQQSSSICQARVCPCHGRHTWDSSQDGCHARVPGQNSRHARVLPSHGCRQDFPKGFFLGGYSTQAPADAESAPEASPVHESAPEASPVHESAPEPPEVAVSTAETSNVVAPTHELPVCLVTAMEVVHELTVCPVTATEAPALPAPPWLPALPVLALPIAPGPSLLHNPSSNNNNNNLLHLYSAFLDTQSALHSKGAISSSTTNVQHPPGWCDGSHSAPERPPHTSLLVERRQSDEANQCMGMIRRPWWSEASGLVWPGCRGNTPTLFQRTSWYF